MPPGGADEPDSLRHVQGRWRLRPLYKSDEQADREVKRVMSEAQAWTRTYRFAEPWPAEFKDKLHKLYEKDIKTLSGGMGCMEAAYKCLETVHPGRPKYDPKSTERDSLRHRVYDTSVNDKKFNGVDLMMETLQKDGLAGSPATVTWDAKANAFKPPPEEELLKMFDHKQEGVYLFGVSIKGGNHTAILAVDNTPQPEGKPPGPRILWLDQSAGGLKQDVTGTLADELKTHNAHDRYNATRIWPLRPDRP